MALRLLRLLTKSQGYLKGLWNAVYFIDFQRD